MSTTTPSGQGSSGIKRKIGLFPATALNMSQMCGVGPFITIPTMIVIMGGPQAYLGWILGALLALCDGLVWAELGASLPGAGGTYVYLREAFGKRTGKLLPFLFVWTAMLFIPLIMSTGIIGFVQYLTWFWPDMSQTAGNLIGLVLIWGIIFMLWRKIESIARLSIVLWVIMLISIGALILAALSHFHADLAFSFPEGAFNLGDSGFWFGMAGGLTIGIYDYLGYNTSAYLAGEVEQPGRVIPKSIVLSIVGILAVYLLMQVGVLGVVDWHRMLDPDSAAYKSVASVVLSETWGSTAAGVVTVLILITAVASVFAGLLGGSRVPFEAAKDKVFFNAFSVTHPKHDFPVYGILSMGVLTSVGFMIGRLTDLTTLIQLLTTVMILVQSVAQIISLFVLRKTKPHLERPYKMWLYPIPAVIALVGWVYIYFASNHNAPGAYPIQWSLVWVAAGCVAYLFWARAHRLWPFNKK
ncbi:APC family permease [Pseudomonas gingeri]|uniref:APC family permease n=1 Tax=Pseudomonas gingeri TaxID=117681 RepID=UPI0015A09EE9|nr:APC family permease [Pseudomonas gingeri]NWD03602.1 APC family permease [Pseudomonas gingeri]NWE33400.1 APC family permease [Pseudomonas gingeri]NWE58411.1 APC family permease [Pseudomonas gingeri]NWE99744.1 APC family permease [Pseudomonas gingeri]